MFVCLSFTLSFVCAHVGHDVINASLYLCLFLYICIYEYVYMLKYQHFYNIFLLYLQFSIFVISVNIMYYYLSILCCCLFIYFFIYFFIFLFIYLYVYLFIYLFIYMFIYLFIHLFLFIYLFIYFFIYLFIDVHLCNCRLCCYKYVRRVLVLYSLFVCNKLSSETWVLGTHKTCLKVLQGSQVLGSR